MKIRLVVWAVIRWLNWSVLKRSFLIGSLSGPNFPVRNRSDGPLTKRSQWIVLWKNTRDSSVWSRNLVLAFLPIILAKTSTKNDIIKKRLFLSFVFVGRLLIEIRFAVRKFAKSHNSKSFIELACSVRIGKILVSFFLWKFMDLVDLPKTDLTLVQ